MRESKRNVVESKVSSTFTPPVGLKALWPKHEASYFV